MPEHIRSLIVILLITTPFFMFARRYAVGFISSPDYERRTKSWLLITILIFVIGNFWIFSGLLLFYVLFAFKAEKNRVAAFIFLLMVLPTGRIPIWGFGDINYLLEVRYQHLITLLTLTPLFFNLLSKNRSFKFGSYISDKFIVAYLLFVFFIYTRDKTTTDVLRQIIYYFVQAFLPYYVISRYLDDTKKIKEALTCLMIALMAICLLAVFEFGKGWLLYQGLSKVLGTVDLTSYIRRAGGIRATVTSGHSLALGLSIMIGIGIYLSYTPTTVKKSAIFILISGLFASLARGSWLGAVFEAFIFLITGKNAIKNATRLIAIGLASFFILTLMPNGKKYIDLIPFVGKEERFNVEYRERVFENSMILIKQNPFTGSGNYLDTPEMEELRLGSQGIIDIVNSYLVITLFSGLIGLSLYLLIFIPIILSLLKLIVKFKDRDSENARLARALLSINVSILFVIATTSMVGIIPWLIWVIAGISVASIRVIQNDISNLKQNQIRQKL